MNRARWILTVFAFWFCFLASSRIFGQGTAFTYQGRLNDNGGPANGGYDLRFILFDADPGGSQQGVVLTNSAVAVTGGLFTVSLDFGQSFPGADRWLATQPGPFTIAEVPMHDPLVDMSFAN